MLHGRAAHQAARHNEDKFWNLIQLMHEISLVTYGPSPTPQESIVG